MINLLSAGYGVSFEYLDMMVSRYFKLSKLILSFLFTMREGLMIYLLKYMAITRSGMTCVLGGGS